MGLTPFNGQLEIKDRYIRIGFNLRYEKADEACLYSDFVIENNAFKPMSLTEIAMNYRKLHDMNLSD